MFESGTEHSGVFVKSQDNNVYLNKMVCLYLEDVNWFYLLQEGRMVLSHGLVLIEGLFGVIYAIAIFMHLIL